MSQGVYVLGGKCPGGKCPGGKFPGGISQPSRDVTVTSYNHTNVV